MKNFPNLNGLLKISRYINFIMSFTDEQNDYFDNVVKLIESTYETNGGKSVILVTHSMGSTMMI